MIARLLILAITISVLIAMWFEPEKKSRLVQVDYCVITRKAAAKDEQGKWHFGWATGYGPCTELDRYENT